MENKDKILKDLDVVIADLKQRSDSSSQSQKDIIMYEQLRNQLAGDDVESAWHTCNLVMDTYLRDMLPESSYLVLGLTKI